MKKKELEAEKSAAIKVDRALITSDLSISNCTVSIVVDLPKEWSTSFLQKAKLKRVSKATTEVTEGSRTSIGGGSKRDSGSNIGGASNSSDSTTGGYNNGGENTDPEG